MAINWIKIYKEHKGKWVALKRDEKTVIASADNARVAYGRAIKNGFNDPIISFVPSQITPMVG
ncbi:hypothetical protein HY947_03360 [Candidatus Gottesmanbacteria bacterium]|nr:hypothetical protein [Candidatus Gottesmanbacteria bacterium]